MLDMYKGMVNSPETTITNDINAVDTIIYVLDETKVPEELPNLMTLGTGTSAETVKVLEVNGNALTVERGFQGVPRNWNAGTVIARNFTEYDYNALKENIETLDGEIGDIDSLSTEEKSNLVGAINEVCDNLVAHKAEKATQDTLGHVIVDGATITIDENGVISAEVGGNVDSVNGKTGEVVIDVEDIAGLVSSRLALGQYASAAGSYSVALGRNASAGAFSAALGRNASAAGSSTVAIGEDASAAGSSTVALGQYASAAGSYSVALGRNASATEINAVAIGEDASATGSYSVALGNRASAENMNEGILGHTGSYTPSNWKVPGSFTVSGTKNFEIPHPKPEKKATHVIRHGAVESPTPGDTLYRWKIQATKENDLVTIDLPDYFVWLNTNVQIFVTPQGHFGNGYGVLNRETEQLEIHCQFEGEYNVLVIGTRNDSHPSVQEWYIKGVEREVGESWTGETYAFSVDEIIEAEEIKEGV